MGFGLDKFMSGEIEELKGADLETVETKEELMEYDLEKIVNEKFEELKGTDLETVDTEKVTLYFLERLKKICDKEFVDILITSGYIPDLYGVDSKEETLFTKLCEVLEVNWATRMGFEAKTVTQKSSYEDVVIKINNKTIVSDTKSFRLGRSQQAPNVKDFVKPEDYSKWAERHDGERLGGLVVYPQLHEWTKKSDAHAYCSDKKNPILMLPFHYLAYFLERKNDFNTNEMEKLWEYDKIFPKKITSRNDYWQKINKAILEITGDTEENFKEFLKASEKKIFKFVQTKLNYLEEQKKLKIKDIESEIEQISEQDIRKEFLKYRQSIETLNIITFEDRIERFRLTEDKKSTTYAKFIDSIFEQSK